jgi:hypothetical protein
VYKASTRWHLEIESDASSAIDPRTEAPPESARARGAVRGVKFRVTRMNRHTLRELSIDFASARVATQIWKYVPQRLYQQFPSADFYLIVDDDVFINRRALLDSPCP